MKIKGKFLAKVILFVEVKMLLNSKPYEFILYFFAFFAD
jgi:hypothetical protein